MKDLLYKIFKTFLIGTVIILGILLVFGVVLAMGWPWGVGFFILTGILGLWLGLIFLKKLWLRRREQQFIGQVVEQDDFYLKQMGAKERNGLQELQDRWKEAIVALKQSHLKKYGNPLYVLPWYMVIGESGSGKTTAIQSAHLSSPFAEINRTSGISGTRNCDWWFFEQAILIDTAGRYAIPVDEGRDKDEWQKFLGLLAKFRKKEPLNGLVVTISSDKLLESGPEQLEEDGKSIRQRMDELMRVLGARFPVYVMVTKCDLIQGMNQFCEHLSEESLNQAMGLINQPISADLPTFLNRVVNTIGEKLRDSRLLIFHKRSTGASYPESSQGIDPGPLLFPEEFERLKMGMGAFIRGAFEENPYQETPILRGIFFSSGRQEGTPYSHFLKELGLIEEKEVLPGTSKGLFLHDFFSRILPTDRGLFAPTQRALDWNRLTKNLGLTSWVTLGIALCGLLSFSFVSNLRDLRELSDQFSQPPAFEGDILADLPVMDGFREKIERVSGRGRSSWIPSFGLSHSKDSELGLKEKYCDRFTISIIDPLDAEITDMITGISSTASDDVVGKLASHLILRINLLNARLDGQDLEELQEKPKPGLEPVMAPADQSILEEDHERFGQLYIYYLDWRSDRIQLKQEMVEMQKLLAHLVSVQRTDLRWIAGWINQDSALEGERFYLEDFWGKDLEHHRDATIAPAFTLAGKKVVDAILDEIEGALADQLTLARQRSQFENWYRMAYIDAWENFAAMFPVGQEFLPNRNTWREIAALVPTNQGPYFLMLEIMAAQLEPFAQQSSKEDRVPAWMRLLFELKATEPEVVAEEAVEKGSMLARYAQRGKEIFSEFAEKAGAGKGVENLKTQMVAGKAFFEYQKALAELSPASSSQKISFQMASDIFKGPDTGDSSFLKALNALQKLKISLPTSGTEQKIFWNLVSGPLDFLWQFISRETACQLQNFWEEEVLVEIQGISDQMRLKQLLFVDPAFAVKFVKGSAAPFIGRSLKKGHYAKTALNSSIPFDNNFLTFLNRGVQPAEPPKQNYYVTIIGRPTSANADARIQPHATRLELQCADEAQILLNRQYPRKKVFNWEPQNCGDVLFQIEVGNLVLERKYSGKRGFANFLKEFARGQKIFHRDDFSEQSAALKRLRINSIKVKYDISGHREVIRQPGIALGKVPEKIISCWE